MVLQYAFRRAYGFQNLVGTSVYGGNNLPSPLVGIGLRWLPKLGVDTSPRPHVHKRACAITMVQSACLFVYWFFATVWQAVYKTGYFCINELETSRHFASQTFAFTTTVLLAINYTFCCWYDKSGLLKFDVILNTVLCWAISTWDDDILLSCSFVCCGLLPLKLILGVAKMSSLHKQSLANQGKN